MNQPFRTIGIYVPEKVIDYFSEYLYEEAGIVDITEYYDSQHSKVPHDDPGATVMDSCLQTVVDNFAALYDAADFKEAASHNPDEYHLVRLAASPETVYKFRDLVDAAEQIQQRDSRTVHTAIFTAAISEEYLPSKNSSSMDR